MEDKNYVIGKQILQAQDLQTQVEVKSEPYTLKLLSPLEKAAVDAEIAQRLGAPRDRCSAEQIGRATVLTTLTVAVVSAPTWFKSPWTCRDEEVTMTLYQKYEAFEEEFRRKLQAGEFIKNS